MLARRGSRVIISPQQEKSHKSETALYGESGLDPHQVLPGQGCAPDVAGVSLCLSTGHPASDRAYPMPGGVVSSTPERTPGMRLTAPFTRVPDVVLDELLPKLSLIELRTLFSIIRYTLGFDRLTTQPLRLEVLGQKTGLSPRSVRRGLTSLENRGLLKRIESPGWASRYELTLPEVELIEDSREPTRTSPGRRSPPSPAKPVRSHVLETMGEREESYFEHEEDSLGCIPAPILQASPSREPESPETPDEAPRSPELPSAEAGELTSIAESAASLLHGKTLSFIRSEEILASLRALKADILNRGLNVDLRQLVLSRVESGIEANFRKNGGRSSIWTWGYFLPRLRDAIEESALVAHRDAQRKAQREEMVREEREQEQRREREQEEETARLRARWEVLDPGEREILESRVMRELPDFIVQCIHRDRQLGKRGTGLIALEQGCLKVLARGIQESGCPDVQTSECRTVQLS